VRNRPGVTFRPRRSTLAVEDQADPVRPTDIEVVADDLFEEHPAIDWFVEHLGQRELGLQDRELISVAGVPVGVTERVRPSTPTTCPAAPESPPVPNGPDRLQPGRVVHGGEGVGGRVAGNELGQGQRDDHRPGEAGLGGGLGQRVLPLMKSTPVVPAAAAALRGGLGMVVSLALPVSLLWDAPGGVDRGRSSIGVATGAEGARDPADATYPATGRVGHEEGNGDGLVGGAGRWWAGSCSGRWVCSAQCVAPDPAMEMNAG
jgi:hypothetical protein